MPNKLSTSALPGEKQCSNTENKSISYNENGNNHVLISGYMGTHYMYSYSTYVTEYCLALVRNKCSLIL